MALPEEERGADDDIDMDRVVIDPDYRQRVVIRLRRDRQLAESRRPKTIDEMLATAGGDED